jgi:hypothetical protein
VSGGRVGQPPSLVVNRVIEEPEVQFLEWRDIRFKEF